MCLFWSHLDSGMIYGIVLSQDAKKLVFEELGSLRSEQVGRCKCLEHAVILNHSFLYSVPQEKLPTFEL